MSANDKAVKKVNLAKGLGPRTKKAGAGC